MPKSPKCLTTASLTDAELITACLDASGLTQEQFSAQVMHSLRTVRAIRKWKQGAARMSGNIRALLERYLSEHQRADG